MMMMNPMTLNKDIKKRALENLGSIYADEKNTYEHWEHCLSAYRCGYWTAPSSFEDVHRNHHFDTIQRLHPLLHPLNTGDASPSIRALDQATLHFMDNCRVVFSFTKKEISTRQGQYLFLFFIIQLSGSRSFPLTSCAFSALFLSRCSIASCFHTFPHLRLSEATQNPCPLCRLSSYRGTR